MSLPRFILRCIFVWLLSLAPVLAGAQSSALHNHSALDVGWDFCVQDPPLHLRPSVGAPHARLSLPRLFQGHPDCLLAVLTARLCGFSQEVLRVGEASHPGPNHSDGPLSSCSNLVIGCSNPSGLRGKESLLVDMGPGIWSLSETQLSTVTQQSSIKKLRYEARALNRNVRIHCGAPAALRSTSNWAGAYTGVMQLGDCPSTSVSIQWPLGVFETGRVQIVQHLLGHIPVTVGNLYGYPQSPLWPDARQRTDNLLEAFTSELVIGRSGLRVICGDFNHDDDKLQQLSIWRLQGWVEVQAHAAALWGQDVVPTCKHTTRRDMLWMSPEMAAWLTSVRVLEVFAEHSFVVAAFSVPMQNMPQWSWPQPCLIPWSEVDMSSWASVQCPCRGPSEGFGATAWMTHFARSYENSLDGFVKGVPGARLPSHSYGRSRRLAPQRRTDPVIPLRRSRPGEEAPRSDFLGLECKRWFQQLRRLQSLHHATAAANPAAGAVAYRIELWAAVRRAKGFSPDFAHWWAQRPVQLQGSPSQLPQGVPSASVASSIFTDFRENYRKFECWHLKQRCKVIKAKLSESQNQLYRSLRQPAPSQVDTLIIHRSYAILASEPNTRQLHLDAPVDTRGASSWSVDGQPVQVQSVEDDVCVVEDSFPFSDAVELEQHQTLSSVGHIQDEFVSLWRPRWQQHTGLPPEHWDRLIAFARAYLPRLHFSFPDISISQWRQAIRRYKPRAARGPDGWSKDDLENMPDAWAQSLLDLLHGIEQGRYEWPEQLLQGFVCSLLKPAGKGDANGFRPICLLSIIYRTWSGIRARQAIAQLSGVVHDECFGFVSGKSSSMLWWTLQVQVELSCQGHQDAFGMVGDIVKAFNALPRRPLLAAAAALGFPNHVLGPWAAFLTGVQRRFVVRDCVSQPLLSTSGFCEGCPLSPVAMLLADLIYHTYLKVFAPSIRSLSYVDNLAVIGNNCGQLAQGVNLSRCVCDLLGLELDASKTYVWAARPGSAASLRALSLPICEHARELGGFMSYGRRTRNAALTLRCKALEPQWQALRRSPAPFPFKLAILPGKFWASALHGAVGCPLPSGCLTSLRAAAVKALGLKSAGSSSMIRLSLCPRMETDPGFWVFWALLKDMRLHCQRMPMLLLQWRSFMASFNGDLFQGPFSQVLRFFADVHWRVLVPPIFEDHEGLRHDLLQIPMAMLRDVAERGWLNFVARQHHHRQTMQDLEGIEASLVSLDAAQMSALDTARLAAIQSGSFLAGASHAHYDASQDGLCPHCHVPDDVEHRLRHCPQYEAARDQDAWVLQHWDTLPTSLTHHLLPPASRLMPLLRAQLANLPDVTSQFNSVHTAAGRQNLFTDGACMLQDVKGLALAGWGVISASTGEVVSCGPLHGVWQTAPRAELCAVISAVRWAIAMRVSVNLWTDCKHVVLGVQRLLDSPWDPLPIDNQDLWSQLAQLLQQIESGSLHIVHIPSHLDPARCESPFEEWVARNNAHADTVAGMANNNRSYAFQQLYLQVINEQLELKSIIRALRGIFFRVAAQTLQEKGRAVAEDQREAEDTQQVPLPVGVLRSETMAEAFPLDWRRRCEAIQIDLPAQFIIAVTEFFMQQDGDAAVAFEVSWIEFAFLVTVADVLEFPAFHPTAGVWVNARDMALRPPLSAAVQIRLLRRALCASLKACAVQVTFLKGCAAVPCGLLMRSPGLLMGVEFGLMKKARARLSEFTATRPIRKSCDLSRRIAG